MSVITKIIHAWHRVQAQRVAREAAASCTVELHPHGVPDRASAAFDLSPIVELLEAISAPGSAHLPEDWSEGEVRRLGATLQGVLEGRSLGVSDLIALESAKHQEEWKRANLAESKLLDLESMVSALAEGAVEEDVSSIVEHSALSTETLEHIKRVVAVVRENAEYAVQARRDADERVAAVQSLWDAAEARALHAEANAVSIQERAAARCGGDPLHLAAVELRAAHAVRERVRAAQPFDQVAETDAAVAVGRALNRLFDAAVEDAPASVDAAQEWANQQADRVMVARNEKQALIDILFALYYGDYSEEIFAPLVERAKLSKGLALGVEKSRQALEGTSEWYALATQVGALKAEVATAERRALHAEAAVGQNCLTRAEVETRLVEAEQRAATMQGALKSEHERLVQVNAEWARTEKRLVSLQLEHDGLSRAFTDALCEVERLSMSRETLKSHILALEALCMRMRS